MDLDLEIQLSNLEDTLDRILESVERMAALLHTKLTEVEEKMPDMPGESQVE